MTENAALANLLMACETWTTCEKFDLSLVTAREDALTALHALVDHIESGGKLPQPLRAEIALRLARERMFPKGAWK